MGLIKLDITVLTSILCDYSYASILVKRTIRVTEQRANVGATADDVHVKKVIFKN